MELGRVKRQLGKNVYLVAPDVTPKSGEPELSGPAELVLRNMMFYLATGWYPWGVKPSYKDPTISLCDDEYIMCCGNWLTRGEGLEAAVAGLLKPGPDDRHQRSTLIITPAGEVWLEKHWPVAPYDTGRER